MDLVLTIETNPCIHELAQFRPCCSGGVCVCVCVRVHTQHFTTFIVKAQETLSPESGGVGQ